MSILLLRVLLCTLYIKPAYIRVYLFKNVNVHLGNHTHTGRHSHTHAMEPKELWSHTCKIYSKINTTCNTRLHCTCMDTWLVAASYSLADGWETIGLYTHVRCLQSFQVFARGQVTLFYLQLDLRIHGLKILDLLSWRYITSGTCVATDE